MPPRAVTANSSPVLETAVFFAAAVIGAAALEAALIPGVVIGGAAWFAPRAIAKIRKRRSRVVRPPATNGAAAPESDNRRNYLINWGDLAITQSAAKTVTFRLISSGLDFGWNYILLGEIAAAASLSGISLIAAPTFYFLHETLWNRYWSKSAVVGEGQAMVEISGDTHQFTLSRPMAKTLTFRTFATISEFSVNYLVVRDLVLASKLSAFGVLAGPFIYLGHEKAWEYYGSRGLRRQAEAKPLLLPPPSP
jgi:uncharacterized membrane protein